jgi:hypothetical protein
VSNWQTIHTVQSIIAGVAVGAESIATKSSGNVSLIANSVGILCTAVVGVLSLYSGAALGPVAAETVRLKSIAPPPLPILFGLLVCIAACGAMTGGGIPPVAVNYEQCVFETVTSEVLAGVPYAKAFEDAATKCLGEATVSNVAQVKRLWMSGRKAMEMTRSVDAGPLESTDGGFE